MLVVEAVREDALDCVSCGFLDVPEASSTAKKNISLLHVLCASGSLSKSCHLCHSGHCGGIPLCAAVDRLEYL